MLCVPQYDKTTVLIQLLTVFGDEHWSLSVISWASLISPTDGVFSASITVDHVYGLVARLFQTLNTKMKHWVGSPKVASMKHFWSSGVSPSWMLICFHLSSTLLATSFIRSESSGLLSSPLYLLPKSAILINSSDFHFTKFSCTLVFHGFRRHF